MTLGAVLRHFWIYFCTLGWIKCIRVIFTKENKNFLPLFLRMLHDDFSRVFPYRRSHRRALISKSLHTTVASYIWKKIFYFDYYLLAGIWQRRCANPSQSASPQSPLFTVMELILIQLYWSLCSGSWVVPKTPQFVKENGVPSVQTHVPSLARSDPPTQKNVGWGSLEKVKNWQLSTKGSNKRTGIKEWSQ
jgi:hypothetical protein